MSDAPPDKESARRVRYLRPSVGAKAAGRAVVLGGSIAGLLAARVLTEFHHEVVVVDRDEMTTTGLPRRGAPQGHHAHALLTRGKHNMESLFPGLTAELTASGVPIGDVGHFRWYVNGQRILPSSTGLFVLTVLRPVLEARLRARVAALPGVRILAGRDIVGVTSTADRRRITGVRLDGASGAETISADLVVDASGRGSRAAVWLEELGYPRVEVDKVKIDLSYTTRHYHLDSDPFNGEQSINPLATPSHPRGAFFGNMGNGRAILSLTGMLGDRPGTDPDAFMAYLKSMPAPEIYDAVRDAEPLGDPVQFRFMESVRRRYERLSRFPDGMVIIGDALCTFNPIYGQGMTVASMEALALRDHLRKGPVHPRRFLRELARIIDTPWDMSAGGDLAWPGVAGNRTAKVQLSNAYMGRLQIAATRDAQATDAFLRVAGLAVPPSTLMRPGMIIRVLRNARPPNAA
jgi:2-polyprenyl-6-methoxyphenol hydroxylase-like FAD-dependent oxidoreductase